jgi:hypothetical protein
MGVSLEKIPHSMRSTVSLVKEVSASMGIDPDRDKAQVVATWDFSGSTEMDENHLYTDGTMEDVNQLAAAAAFTFDDDGDVPQSLFHDGVIDLGNLNPDNCEGFITRAHQNNRMGGTAYLPALKWIVETVGLDVIDLGQPGDPLEIKCPLNIAVYAYFVTDGEPNDSRNDIEEYLRRMSQLPIFVQFIGVGSHNFQFLRTLDNLTGRLIDNAGFFDAKKVLGERKPPPARRGLFGRKNKQDESGLTDDQKRQMLGEMLNEFPSFYQKARNIGLITS